MLPDGAHLREEDWTFFILNQHIVEEVITSINLFYYIIDNFTIC